MQRQDRSDSTAQVHRDGPGARVQVQRARRRAGPAEPAQAPVPASRAPGGISVWVAVTNDPSHRDSQGLPPGGQRQIRQ